MENKDLKTSIGAINKAAELSEIIKEGIVDSENATNWMNDNENMADFVSKMSDSEFVSTLGKKRTIIEKNKKDNAREIMLRINQHNRRTIMFKRILSVSVAASIVVMVMFAYNLNNISNGEIVAVEYLQKPVVDYSKPTLSLSSGVTLNLPLDEKNAISENKLLPNQMNKEKSNEGDFLKIDTDSIIYKTLTVPNTYTYTVELPDGTVVILNARSEFKYPEKFDKDNRTVELIRGEAYFKVKKDSIPFYVNCSNTAVRVYGTEFNINRSGLNEIKTVLVKGSVGVGFNDSKEHIVIKPNELITLNQKDKTSKIEVVNTEKYIAWTSGYFHFDGIPLGEVLKSVGEWYGVKFRFENNDITDKLLVGAFQKSAGLDNIILSICDLKDVEIKKEGELHIVR